MSQNRKILFIGGMFFENTKQEIIRNSKSMIQNAANKLQWNYVRGLEANCKDNIDILNGVFIGCYPKNYKKIVIPSHNIEKTDRNGMIEEVGFINLPIICSITKLVGFKKKIKKWININKKEQKIIVAYGFFEENILALKYAKKLDPTVCTCLIILDLPEFMGQGVSQSIYKSYLNSSAYRKFEQSKQYIDCYSVITNYIAEKLCLKNNYVIIEGMIECEKYSDMSQNIKDNDSKFSFLYTGGLSESYGIRDMIESFILLDNSDAELWICGDGPMLEEIKSFSNENSGIKYLGVLSQEECLELQHKANCLINPRLDSEMTKYSFPSKTMEYLASGTPVIAKQLHGMPEDYEELFFSFENKDGIKQSMKKVMSLSPEVLNNKAKKAQQYIYENKNNYVQTQKLFKLFNDLLDKSTV